MASLNYTLRSCIRTKPLAPALRKQRQLDLYESGASLVYTVSSRTAGATWRSTPVVKSKGLSLLL